MPSYGISTYGMLRKNFRIDELQCCSNVEVLVCKAVKKCSSVGGQKKSARTDLDLVDFEKKISKSQCSNRKIGVDWSRQSQKRSLQRQVSLIFFRTGHPGVAECVLHVDGLPLTRGAVVATPFAAAVSLTFSLVKNLQMLLQAKRQPG